jgi:hypothetical protein
VTQSASSVTLNGSTARITLAPASGDAGRASTTLSAAAGQNCYTEAGTAMTNSMPCGTAQMTPSGTQSASLWVYGRSMNIASIAAAASTNYAYTTRLTSPSGTMCPSTATPGCTHAGVRRALGTAAAGGPLSGAAVPAGFTGMTSVTGYQVNAVAESGVGAAAPAVSRAGTLSYWNGTDYTTVSLAGVASATYTLPAVSQSFTNDGHNVVVTMSGEVSLGSVTTTPTGVSPCQPNACTMASSAGGVVTTLDFTVQVDGSTVASFTAASDLGSALATTSYRAAPSA